MRSMIPLGAGALTNQTRRESLGERIPKSCLHSISKPWMAVAAHGTTEWTSCGRKESAGFDGSFSADSTVESSMIRAKVSMICAKVSMIPSDIKERVREMPAPKHIYMR